MVLEIELLTKRVGTIEVTQEGVLTKKDEVIRGDETTPIKRKNFFCKNKRRW